MRHLPCALVAALSLTTLANGGLVDLVSEVFGINAIQTIPGQPGEPDSWSMRLWAVVDGPDDTVNRVYGTPANPMLISASTQFYQNTFGGPTSLDIDPADYAALPDMAYDSWVTIGADSMHDNLLQVTGVSFGAFNTGSPLYSPAGEWTVSTGAPQASPMLMDGQWRVLLGQFSIIGPPTSTLSVQLNLSGSEAGGGDWAAGGSWTFNAVPGPGGLALMMTVLAAGRRRRAAFGRAQ